MNSAARGTCTAAERMLVCRLTRITKFVYSFKDECTSTYTNRAKRQLHHLITEHIPDVVLESSEGRSRMNDITRGENASERQSRSNFRKTSTRSFHTKFLRSRITC